MLASQKLMVFHQTHLNLKLLESEPIYDVFRYIALASGANITPSESLFVLLNRESVITHRKTIEQMKDKDKKLLFIDVKWLVDSFFMNTRLEFHSYLI